MENQSIEDVLQLRKPVRNYYEVHKEQITKAESIAVWVSDHIGTVGFFVILIVWTVLWLLWNTLGPVQYRFDPFPAFEVWVFTANVIQLTLMPLIIFGQKIQEQVNKARSDEEYEINLREEREIAIILNTLKQHGEMLESISSKLNSK